MRVTFTDLPTFTAEPGLYAMFRGRRVRVMFAPKIDLQDRDSLEFSGGPVSRSVPVRIVRAWGSERLSRLQAEWLRKKAEAAGYRVRIVDH